MADPLASYPVTDGWNNSPQHQTAFASSSTSQSPPSTASAVSAGGGEPSFSREPRVFGMPSPSLTSPVGAQGGPSSVPGKPTGPVLKVRISGLERNRKDLLIRYDASTNLPNFRTSLYRNMQRSYVEFQLFAEQMAVGNPQTIVPALPLPQTSAVTDEEDDRLVKQSMQKWFSRVCDDVHLQKDDELRSFIESDFGYQPVPRHSSTASTGPQATGSFANIHTASSVSFSHVGIPSAFTRVFKRGPPDEEEDLAAAKGELERLESRWGGSAMAVGKVGLSRRTLATAEADTGAKLISLATVEPNQDLSNVLRKLGRSFESLAGLLQAQSVSDNIVLSDTLGYQALNARAAKATLTNRVAVLEDAQNAAKAAINKRRTVERMKGSSNMQPQRVDDAIEEMREAQDLDELLSQRVYAISTNLRASLQEHSRQAHEDAANILFEHARSKIMYERQAVKELESLRPDIKAIGTGTAGVAVRGAGRAAVAAATTFQQPTQSFQGPPLLPPQQQQQQQQIPYRPTGPQSAPLPSHTFPQPQQQQQQRQPFSQPQQPYDPRSNGNGLSPQGQVQGQQPNLSQSMMLPPPQGQGQVGQPQYPQQSQVHPHHMAQSMYVPSATTQRRKLDERAAARSLANMF